MCGISITGCFVPFRAEYKAEKDKLAKTCLLMISRLWEDRKAISFPVPINITIAIKTE